MNQSNDDLWPLESDIPDELLALIEKRRQERRAMLDRRDHVTEPDESSKLDQDDEKRSSGDRRQRDRRL